MKIFILTLGFVLNYYHGIAKVLPNGLPPPCPKSSPDFSDCTLKYINQHKMKLINGVRELKIPNMNPFYLPSYSTDRSLNDMITISATVKDMKIWGFEDTEFKKYKFDPNTLSGEMELYFPKLYMTFEYDGSGKFLSPVPMQDAGFLKTNLTGFTAKTTFTLKTVEKKGVKYYVFDEIHAEGDVEDAQINLTSKNPDNQSMIEFFEKFINEDPKRAYTASAPIINETIETISRIISGQIMGVIPADELIPI